jgi:hypothetical protein
MLTAIPSLVNVPPLWIGLPAESVPLPLLISPVGAWLVLLGVLALCGALLLLVTAPPVLPRPRRRPRPVRPVTSFPQRA